jgi:hypothetical protein
MTAKDALPKLLEEGDFAQARKLSRGTADEEEIFYRTGPDALMVKIAIGCVFFFAVIVYVYGS